MLEPVASVPPPDLSVEVEAKLTRDSSDVGKDPNGIALRENCPEEASGSGGADELSGDAARLDSLKDVRDSLLRIEENQEKQQKLFLDQAPSDMRALNLICSQLIDENKILKQDLNKKRLETERLHRILQSTQGTDDMSDDQVEKKFSALYNGIYNISQKHIAKVIPDAEDEALRIPDTDDKRLWIRAMFALEIYLELFSEPVFGLSSKGNKSYAKLEEALRRKSYPERNLWRVETTKALSFLQLSDGHEYIDRLVSKTIGFLHKHATLKDEDVTRDALCTLYKSAYDLSLSLRKSMVEYEWRQIDDNSTDPSHYDIISDYHEMNGNGGHLPHRILFGPVLKLDGQNFVCIRGGEMLVPNELKR